MPPKKKAAKAKKPAAKKKAPTKKAPEKKSTSKKDAPEKKPAKSYQNLRGMKDILPTQGRYWMQLMDAARNVAEAYCYGYLETPVLEHAQLFVKTIGRGTDVIDKEMYVFEDRDGSKVAMRPEFTAGVARAYISHGMLNQPQPVKVWTMGQLFRHDRPQAGRYRQFHQFNCEVIGDRDPVIDAELITMAYALLKDIGIQAEVKINSIGSAEDRQNYVIELVGYLRSKRSYLSDESKKRINKNPLRILDSKDEGDREVIAEAPQIIEWLSSASKDYFMKVLEYLDELQIPYVLTPTLVRGLDYYSDTVFELFVEGDEGSQRALGGGGRYDALLETLGAREPTPACGFAMGMERIVLALQDKEKKENDGQLVEMSAPKRQFFFAQLGEQARRRSLYLIETLRKAGMLVGSSLSKGSLKVQLELANKMGSSHAIIIGQKEVQDGTVIIRDMDSGIQEIIDQKKLEAHLQKLRKG